MIILNPQFDPALFFKQLAEATARVLFLDYDGTLAPFTPDREKAFPYPGVSNLVDRLLEAPCNRVVLISGRAIESLAPLLGLRNRPEIWGSHGLERLLSDGTYRTASLEDHALQAIDDAEKLAAELNRADLVERKPAGIAIHTRGLGNREAHGIIAQVTETWEPLAQRAGLTLHTFDGGMEMRVPGIDKGLAVETVLSETPEHAVVAYFGDDLTDEDAFRAIKGRGMGVLVRPEQRKTDADVWLRPPEELNHVLKRWLAACGDGQ